MNMHNNGMKYMRLIQMLRVITALLMMTVYAQNSTAQESGYVLESVDYIALPGNKMQVKLGFNKPVLAEISSFSIDNPARVSIDIPSATVSLEKKAIRVDSGVINNIRAVEASGRSRVVVGLNTMVPYEIRNEQNNVYINFDAARGSLKEPLAEQVTAGQLSMIDELSFRRGVDGEGKISISISNPNTVVNVDERGTKLIVDFINTKLSEKLVRRLDVTDFATPITTIDAFNVAGYARVVIESVGDYEHMAYQAGSEFAVNVTRLDKDDIAEKKKDEFGYSGEKLSLNFQNIEVRAVLQLLADFTGLNVVASDTVQGNITLRLKNVPWDQALDIILRTRGLGMRKTGNVVLIAPNAEISAREKEELEAEKQRVDLAPVHTRHHQINYAKAAEIAKLLKGEKNSILTERGSVTIDDRTNTLMVLESNQKHEEIAALIQKLDVPVRQVMIESRIVIANDDFGRDIGVQLGVSAFDEVNAVGRNSDILTTSGGTNAASGLATDVWNVTKAGTGSVITFPEDRYNVTLPASGAGRIAMALLGDSFLVDLELSALQTEGRGEVLSNPRVITSNQQTASIEQGVEIPYQEASSSGATSISFKKAVLSLEVTPQITPDDRVVMDLAISKDSIGGIYAGIPSVNTRSVNTQVLVNNGDTVVLGGIYEQEVSEGATKVPLLGDIPLLGVLFRSKSKKESKAELLIFVTPKIINDSLKVAQ
ncbi:MAG: type IV pilus secretin PilQ [Pseudomonadota bacterium]